MIKNFTKNYCCLVVLTAILVFAQGCHANKAIITHSDEYPNTETNFFDVNGNKVYLDQYEGNTILLVFWAMWCGGCISELPSLDNLAKDFRKLPFQVIAVSEDYQGASVIKEYFESNEIRHLEVFHDHQNQLFKALSVAGLPSAFLINASGKIKVIFKGGIKWHENEIRAMILAEIDGNPEMPKNTYSNPALNKKVSNQLKKDSQNLGTDNNKGVNNNDGKKQEPKQ